MLIAFTLLAAFVQSGQPGTAFPPPDFATLMPAYPKEGLTVQEHAVWVAGAEEFKAYAQFLTKGWNLLTKGTADPVFSRHCLMVLRDLDDCLDSLNPKPTAAEAEARVRAYHAVVAVVLHDVTRAEVKGETPPASRDEVRRTTEHFRRRYQALLSRSE